MVRWFNEEADNAIRGRKSAIRARQAWQYLICKAAARQTVRYDELRDMVEYPTNNPLIPIVGCISNYCRQNELPPLTLLVVKKSGVPGEGFWLRMRQTTIRAVNVFLTFSGSALYLQALMTFRKQGTGSNA